VDADDGGGEEVAGHARRSGVTVGEDCQSFQKRRGTGVDVVVARATEAVPNTGLRPGRNGPAADSGEVGGGLAVEQPRSRRSAGGKRLDAAGFDLVDERVEAVPVMLAGVDPEV